jgi:hypothetical protein
MGPAVGQTVFLRNMPLLACDDPIPVPQPLDATTLAVTGAPRLSVPPVFPALEKAGWMQRRRLLDSRPPPASTLLFFGNETGYDTSYRQFPARRDLDTL